VGVAVLIGGAWVLVGGGTRMATALGVQPVVVGLTVVAFGTSAPELFVSLVGALRGNSGIALGNVIGSNVANIGLILGLAALLRPVPVEAALRRREVPLMLVASLVFAAMVWDGVLARVDAAVLTAGFLGFLEWTRRGAARGLVAVPVPEVAVVPGHKLRESARGAALVVVGVGALAGGGRLIVTSAVDLALRLGLSETLIGLTLVAVGTSLPELATTAVAAARQQHDLALGNLVGSNIFNILAVAGPVGLVRPLVEESSQGRLQLICLVGLAALLTALVAAGRGALSRRQGVLLLATYAVVMVIWTTGS
jgi:cation:H+ antiporter